MGISWLAPSVGAAGARRYVWWPVELVAERRRRDRDGRRRPVEAAGSRRIGAATGLRRSGPAVMLRCRANQPAAAAPAAAMAAAETDADKLRFIESVTADVGAVQERVLAEILARNADAEYLAKCGLAAGAAVDRATFRAKVPMATYEELKPYIQRVAGGDRSPILSGSGHPVSELLASASTSTGERKLIPVVEDDHDRHHRLHSLVMAVVNQYVPGLDKGSGLYFLFVRSETPPPSTTTPGGGGGLPVRTALTKIFRSDGFWKLPYNPERGLTTPPAAIVCADTFQSTYAQLLCGLRHRHAVVRVGAAFASGLLRAIRFFRHNFAQLADDIGAGTLTDRVTDPALRQALLAAGLLRRDPELADLVRAEGARCGNGSAGGIVRRLWPNAKFVHVVATGSMAHYVPAVDFYSGGLPIVSTAYFSSECGVGINLRPICDPSEVSYTVVPTMAYFEFLPTDVTAGGGGADELVELAGVEVGREYELVVTTYSGLCRYRVGDVLRVTGFHNTSPEFRFVRRRDAVLSVDADETTDEVELQRAVDRASAALLAPRGAAVVDYTARTTCADGETTVPGHYVVYWELEVLGGAADVVVDGEVLERCCLAMEEALGSVYRRSRVAADGAVGPLEIRVVRRGTFDELADLAVARGASIGQYKVPRCVVAAADIELLDSRVVSRHFSPTLPSWAPGQRF